VCEQGVLPPAVYLIEEGIVKLVRWEADNAEPLVVGTRSCGWLLGAPAALLDQPLVASAETVTRCRLQVIDAGRFRALVRSSGGSVAWDLHRLHAQEICMQMQLAGVGTLCARQRLERLLDELVREDTVNAQRREPMRLHLPFKQRELAELIHVTPQWLSRLFRELEAEGVVRWAGPSLLLVNPSRLCQPPRKTPSLAGRGD